MKGFTTPKIQGKFSLRASITGQIALDDVHVPKANLLPKVTGLKVRRSRLFEHNQGIASLLLGTFQLFE